MKDHRLIDERSLAFDRLIAAKLRANPALVEKARENLRRRLATAAPAVRPALQERQFLLDGPLDTLLLTLENTDPRATHLRQSSPFCGILMRAERTRILKDFEGR